MLLKKSYYGETKLKKDFQSLEDYEHYLWKVVMFQKKTEHSEEEMKIFWDYYLAIGREMDSLNEDDLRESREFVKKRLNNLLF